MAPNIREKFARGVNPFDFKGKNSFIRPLDRGISKLNDRGPCVVMASPGFLTNGASRELLEKWAPDPRNGLIITGYSVEGVMARVSASSGGKEGLSYTDAFLRSDNHERADRDPGAAGRSQDLATIVSHLASRLQIGRAHV